MYKIRTNMVRLVDDFLYKFDVSFSNPIMGLKV